MADDKVFVFVHGADGKAVGAGALIGTWERHAIAGTFAGVFADYDRDGEPDEVLAVVQGSPAWYVVPLDRISDVPQHPGYQR
jgi:hypothetical protein